MPTSNEQKSFPGYIRVNNVDQSLLADLTLRAKGDRSLSDFARLCNVNPSTLSRLVNQKNNGPCSDSLIKAIAENAEPDSGVTLEMLLEAQGYIPVPHDGPQVPEGASSLLEQFQKAVEDLPSSSAIEAAQDSLKKVSESTDAIKTANEAQKQLKMCQKQLSYYREQIDRYQVQINNYHEQLHQLTKKLSEAEEKASDKEQVENTKDKSSGLIQRTTNIGREEEFERDAQEILINALVNAGFFVKLDNSVREMNSHRYFDFGISTDALEKRNIKRWYFEVKLGVYSVGMRFLDNLFRELYFNSFYDDGIAVSLIISDRNSFERIQKVYGNREIYDYVSVILVDRSDREIVDEFVFAQRGQKTAKSIFKGRNSNEEK